MTIQVVVYFWPNKNLGFGHIAASVYEIIDNQITREEYISWCHGNNKQYDLEKYGHNYLIVKLPEHNNIVFKTFIDQYAESFYFCNFQLISIFITFKNDWNPKVKLEENINVFYESFIVKSAKNLENDFINYCCLEKKLQIESVFKEFITERYFFFQNIREINDWNSKISFLENIKHLIRSNLDIYFIYIKYILENHESILFNEKKIFNDNKFNRIINFYSEYNFISNNCAHAIEYILSITGYHYKANKAFFLTPETTFDSACELALALQKQAKNKLKIDKSINYFDKIKSLIKRDIEIFQIGIPKISKIKKIDVLNKLLETQEIAGLSKQLYIEAYKYKNFNKSFSDSLFDYLTYIPKTHQRSTSLAEIQIHIALDKMLDKANLLEKQSSKTKDSIILDSAFIAKKLVADLRNKTNAYFSQTEKINILDLALFKSECKQIIEQAEPILAAHRGWKHILAAVALTITTLGIGSLLVCLINKISTGRFSFFHTQSHAKLIAIEKTIQSVDKSLFIRRNICA